MEKEFYFLKTKQNEEILIFEGQLEKMSKDLESLQRENNNLRNQENKLRQEVGNYETQRDNYRDKYQETKLKNNQMSSKMAEVINNSYNIYVYYFRLKMKSSNCKTACCCGTSRPAK